MERVTLDDLMTMSRNLHTHAKNTETANNSTLAMIRAVEAELEVADGEAMEARTIANRYESGYQQGWADAVRMILGAMRLHEQHQ
jgi:hypothetical protein